MKFNFHLISIELEKLSDATLKTAPRNLGSLDPIVIGHTDYSYMFYSVSLNGCQGFVESFNFCISF